MTAITADRPIAVIGRSGQVAEALRRRAHRAGIALVNGGRPDVDFTSGDSVSRFILSTRPSIVINAAAYTAVDQAESEPDAALALNGEAPARLAAFCSVIGIPLIHISTDFVFSGLTNRPYLPDAPLQPLGVYGASKAAGELGVRAALERHAIVRTSWVYGVAARNFVKTMLRLGAERGEVSVVDDQVGAPTFADDLADALLKMSENMVADDAPSSAFGTYHFSNGGQTSWCGFANAVFARAGSQGKPLAVARPIATAEYPTPARRPPYSVLDTASIQSTHGINVRGWETALDEAMPLILARDGLSL